MEGIARLLMSFEYWFL